MPDEGGSIRYGKPVTEERVRKLPKPITRGQRTSLSLLGCPVHILENYLTDEEAIAAIHQRIGWLLSFVRQKGYLTNNSDRQWTAAMILRLCQAHGLVPEEIPWIERLRNCPS